MSNIILTDSFMSNTSFVVMHVEHDEFLFIMRSSVLNTDLINNKNNNISIPTANGMIDLNRDNILFFGFNANDCDMVNGHQIYDYTILYRGDIRASFIDSDNPDLYPMIFDEILPDGTKIRIKHGLNIAPSESAKRCLDEMISELDTTGDILLRVTLKPRKGFGLVSIYND